MKPAGPAIVAVVLSSTDLKRAINLRVPPDYFELRLDALAPEIASLKGKIERLKAPLIITARHPSEGGLNRLAPRVRQSLLRQFLPHATFIDVELRSSRPFASVLKEARARSIGTIISFHDLNGTPSAKHLAKIAHAAGMLKPDVMKVATRTDYPMQFARLRDFVEQHRGKRRIAVMGIGRLGRRFREEFAGRTAFNYVYLGTNRIQGQLSMSDLKRFLKKTRRSTSPLSIRAREHA